MSISTATEADNRIVWDRRPGHYEVWYTTISHLPSRTGFWLRYAVSAPIATRGEPYAQLWFSRFSADSPDENFGIHKRFALASFDAAPSPFRVSIGGAEQRHDGSKGALKGAGHEVSWDLSWSAAERTHHHLPAILYKGTLGDTKVLSPNVAVAARGEIVVDGRTYNLDNDPAEQSHVWGKKQAYNWAWSHCSAFDGGVRGAWFESVSACLKRGAIVLPRLTTFTLSLDGEEIAYREPWRIPLARSQYQTGRYHLVGSGPKTRIEAEITCRPEDMILSEYVDPDGDAAFCHSTCVADLRINVRRRSPFSSRFRDAVELVATRTAHWEWAARAGDAANVKRWNTLITDAGTGTVPHVADPPAGT